MASTGVRRLLDTTIFNPAIKPWSPLTVLLARHDLAGQRPLPSAGPAEGQRPFRGFSADVPDLLALGVRGAPVIVPGLVCSARFMSWSHVVDVVRAPEFQRPDVLNNPALAHPICGFR